MWDEALGLAKPEWFLVDINRNKCLCNIPKLQNCVYLYMDYVKFVVRRWYKTNRQQCSRSSAWSTIHKTCFFLRLYEGRVSSVSCSQWVWGKMATMICKHPPLGRFTSASNQSDAFHILAMRGGLEVWKPAGGDILPLVALVLPCVWQVFRQSSNW